MFRPALVALMAIFAAPSLGLDDLPVYIDAGCTGTTMEGGLGNGFAQGPSDMVLGKKANGDKTVPVTCADKLSGTDAILIKLARKLKNGEYWDFGVKFADDRAWSIKKFTDIRFWVKNRASSIAKVRVGLEAAGGSPGKMKLTEIPVGTEWKELVIPLTEVGGDSIYGLKISQATDQYGGADTTVGPLDLLIDMVRITDGTGLHGIEIPAIVHQPRPANWTPNFLLGSFDNRELGKSTKAQQAGMPYRYQYVMPDIKTYYSRSTKGYVYDYAMFSDTLGVKTAIVWYNLGKVGEGWGPVTKNLADASYMNDYFDRYDWVLDQLAMAGQSDYMIIVEPDMYGFLMRGPGGSTGSPVDDPTQIAVAMGKANTLSGKTWDANLAGWAKYLVWRAKQKLTKGVIIGHMPNHWGVSIPGQVGQGRLEAHYISASTIGRFLSGFGKDGIGDVVFVEKSDHDAGHKPAGENWLWDSTNYAKYFFWTRVIANKTGLPICGWQVSEGNMSNKKEWKDDAAETYLAHPDWWIAGGFAGILFGAGNADCVNYLNDLDGGWFVDHMAAAAKSPVPLPAPTGVGKRSSATTSFPTMTASSKAVRFDGFSGEGTAVFMDGQGRTRGAFAVKPGQILSRSILPRGFALVRLATSAGNRSFALLP